MPRSPFDRRLLRAALAPDLVLWAVLRSFAWPGARLKKLRRDRRRNVRKGPQGRPANAADPVALEAVRSRPGPFLLLAGAGLGEFVTMRRIAVALRRARPDAKIGYALRDNNALDHAREQEPGASVAYWPYDGFVNALRLLGEQRPDVVAIVENFRYPAFVPTAARAGVRVAMVNGRNQRRRSFERPLGRFYYRRLFGRFAAMGMQTDADRATVAPLVSGDCDLRTTGDVKLDVQILELAPERGRSLEAWLEDGAPLVGAGSTNGRAEESMVLDAFVRARAATPCRLLIAPRQTSGAEPLLEMVAERGLTVSRRSKGEGSADVLILDTQGELAVAYGACVAAYVGGSFAPDHGGHNIMEPLAWGVPVAYGPYRKGFEATQLLAEEGGVGARIAGAEELARFWTRYLDDAGARDAAREAAGRLVAHNGGAVERTVALLLAQMDATGI